MQRKSPFLSNSPQSPKKLAENDVFSENSAEIVDVTSPVEKIVEIDKPVKKKFSRKILTVTEDEASQTPIKEIKSSKKRPLRIIKENHKDAVENQKISETVGKKLKFEKVSDCGPKLAENERKSVKTTEKIKNSVEKRKKSVENPTEKTTEKRIKLAENERKSGGKAENSESEAEGLDFDEVVKESQKRMDSVSAALNELQSFAKKRVFQIAKEFVESIAKVHNEYGEHCQSRIFVF